MTGLVSVKTAITVLMLISMQRCQSTLLKPCVDAFTIGKTELLFPMDA